MKVLYIKTEFENALIGIDNFTTKILNKENIYNDKSCHKFLLDLPKETYSHIIISVEEGMEQSLINLTCHIRLTPFFKSIYRLPILILGRTTLMQLLKYENSSILLTDKIEYYDRYDLSKEKILNEIFPKFLTKKTINYTLFQKDTIANNKFIISPPSGSSHQIANEWGAYRLASTFEKEEILNSIEEKQEKSKSLYFKFLKQKFNINPENSEIQSNNVFNGVGEVLLIDDNYDKGWDIVLAAIIKSINPNIKTECFKDFENLEEDENSKFEKIISDIKRNNYKIIFLDLRLNKKEHSKHFDNVSIQKFSGARLLKLIKQNLPSISIIMFTASNKAWNFEQLTQLGADGFYIKEHPETFISNIASKTNFDNLIITIKRCLEKQQKLSPFYKLIKKIESNILVEEKLISITDSVGTRLISTDIKKRLIERLWMSFGLIKRNFEDSKYNSDNFYYSDLELAFITLWSCLIDIQFIYFDKDEPGIKGDGNPTKNIKIHSYLLDKVNIPKIPIENIYLLKSIQSNPSHSTLKVDYNNPTKIYELSNFSRHFNTNNYPKRIGAQIAFLILSIEKGDITKDSGCTLSGQTLTQNLYNLKEKRNKLYLTHGDEDENSDYFTLTVRESNRITLDDCKRLFEIIYFLLTAEMKAMI